MSVDGQEAWRAFAAALGDAAGALEWPGLELDDLDRAEGLRYLARLAANGVQAQFADTSAAHPAFSLVPNGFGMDNPDNHYLGAPVDPRFDYRITSRRGHLSYLSFAAQNQNFAASSSITGGAGHLHGGQIACDPDGRFVIVASQRPQRGNWLRLAQDSRMILARQTRADPRREHWVDVAIERVGPHEPPAPLDPGRVGQRLEMVARYAGGAAAWFCDWVRPWLERPNEFSLADPEEQRRIGGDPNIVAQSAYWTLGPDEALVVELTPPPCAYWNIQLANVWAESLDTRRPVWRNNTGVVTEDDGSATMVVAHSDPGHPNWLDTAGHRHGTAHIRYVLAGSSPSATTRVVPFSQVPAPPAAWARAGGDGHVGSGPERS